jgi:hypothetical protein
VHQSTSSVLAVGQRKKQSQEEEKRAGDHSPPQEPHPRCNPCEDPYFELFTTIRISMSSNKSWKRWDEQPLQHVLEPLVVRGQSVNSEKGQSWAGTCPGRPGYRRWADGARPGGEGENISVSNA